MNVPALWAGGITLAGSVAGALAVVKVGQRTAQSNETTAKIASSTDAASTVVTGFNLLLSNMQTELLRIQGQLDDVRPKLAAEEVRAAEAQAMIIDLRALLATAEAAGTLQRAEIDELHKRVDDLELLIKTIRSNVAGIREDVKDVKEDVKEVKEQVA